MCKKKKSQSRRGIHIDTYREDVRDCMYTAHFKQQQIKISSKRTII